MARDRSKELGPGERWLTPKPIAEARAVVSDQNLIRWEFYNRNDCAIIFDLMPEKVPYIRQMGITVGFKRAKCAAGEFLVLNHAFYIARAIDGRPFFDMHRNVGKFIGIGNKNPTRPPDA